MCIVKARSAFDFGASHEHFDAALVVLGLDGLALDGVDGLEGLFVEVVVDEDGNPAVQVVRVRATLGEADLALFALLLELVEQAEERGGGLLVSALPVQLQDLDVVFTVTYRVEAVKRRDGKLAAIFGSDYGKVNKERIVDQVVINHGTLPMDELYFELRPLSSNEGAVEQHDLIAGKAQNLVTNPAGRFQLFRIGDAVAARNTHAAIYDALRLVKDL